MDVSMKIDDWIKDKDRVIGRDRMSAGSQILVAWWKLSKDAPEMQTRMREAADKILEKWPA